MGWPELAVDLIFRGIGAANRSKQEAPRLANMASPFTRLAIAGIAAIRNHNALIAIERAILEGHLPGQRYARELDALAADKGADFVVWSGSQLAVLESEVSDITPDQVNRVDNIAQAIRRLTDGEADVIPIVCTVVDARQPSFVPAHSGRSVITTSVGWLPGLLRQKLNDLDREAPLWPRLAAQMDEADERLDTRRAIDTKVNESLDLRQWWYADDIRLDDSGGDKIDIIIAGPTGVFVVECVGSILDETTDSIRQKAQRLRPYVPWADVVPIIASSAAGEFELYGPPDAAGFRAGLVGPEWFIPMLHKTRLKGINLQALAHLNSPAPGWLRWVTYEANGHPRIQWRMPAEDPTAFLLRLSTPADVTRFPGPKEGKWSS